MARSYSLVHLSDADLLQGATPAVTGESGATAWVIAHIAEIDRRKLYVPAGYPYMRDFCVHKLHLSEDAAKKRIQVARAALNFPVIFQVLEAGKVHLSGLNVLAPYLTRENVDALLAAATHKSLSEIELLIANRFPKTQMMPLIEARPSSTDEHSSAAPHLNVHVANGTGVQSSAAPHPNVHVGAARSSVRPTARDQFDLHCPIDVEIHGLLQLAEELLSPQVAPGDTPEILRRALRLLVATERKRKLGSSTQPRKNSRRSSNGRYIPKHVRLAVFERDGGRCTFVSESGLRCSCRRGLQFDHILEFARGGEATVENLRLRCHAHNQYEAEQTYGAGFMEEKREAARREQAERNTQRAGAEVHSPSPETMADGARRPETIPPTETSAQPDTVAQPESVAEAIARAKATAHAEAADDRDVTPWLKELGFRADEIRRAATFCETVNLPIAERVRVAISYLRPGSTPDAGSRSRQSAAAA